MSIYGPIDVALRDLAITKPLPLSQFYYGKAPKFGPRYRVGREPRDAPYIENFQPPVFQPNPEQTYIAQGGVFIGGSSIPEKCPTVPISLRNEWETMNTTNAVAFGGMDRYNIKNIPSCNQRSGDYLSFYDYMKVTPRTLV